MKKVICFDARMIRKGGIGTYIKNLLPYFVDFPFKFKLLVPSKEPEFCSFETIEFNTPIYSLQEQYKYSFSIPSCDLFWSPHFNVPVFPLRAKKRLVTIHDVFHLAHFSSLTFFEKAYAKLLYSKAAKKSDHIITVSDFSQKEIERYLFYAKGKISKIYSGINSHLFSSSSIKQESFLPKKYFLFVGNLKPHKNIQAIVKAFGSLLDQGIKDYELVIVGKSKGMIHAEDIKKYVSQNKLLQQKMHIFENIKDDMLPTLYAKAKALLFVSLYEGFGLPPLEAMNMECPVIASNRASIPEACQSAAYYIDPYHYESITDAMKKFIFDSGYSKKFKELGKRRAQEFCSQKSACEHLKILQKLI